MVTSRHKSTHLLCVPLKESTQEQGGGLGEPKSATAIHVRVYLWYHHKDIRLHIRPSSFLLPLPANLEVKSGDISSQIHPSALCSSQGVHTGNRPPTTRPLLAKSRHGGAESEPNAVCEEQRVEIAAGPIVARLRPGRCGLCAGGSSVLLGATFRKGCHCERH